MIEKVVQRGDAQVRYFQKGENPVWLMYSGTHGDEAGVALSIERYLAENAERLPDFLWVPHVSPSAVAAKVRHNARGLDTNRNFLDDSTEEEVVANLQIVHGKSFEYFLDFHEDEHRKEFYVYDSLGVRDGFIEALLQAQHAIGFDVWHGLDDDTDSALGNMVNHGYVDASNYNETSGFSVDYMLTKGIVKQRAWTFETPGLVTQEEKDKIVNNIFKTLLDILYI